MEPSELELLIEELKRTHEQYRSAMASHRETLAKVRSGEISDQLIAEAIRVADDSVEMCRGQYDATRRTIRNRLG